MSSTISTTSTTAASTTAVAEPQVLVERIKTLLARQEFLAAQQAAVRAAEEFPDEPWLQKAKRVLHPTRVASTPATGPERTRELEWLRRNGSAYRGKWVALLGDDLIAAGGDFDTVWREVQARPLKGKPLVHRID